MKSGKCLRTYEGHEGWVQSIVYASLNRFISAGGDKTSKLWNIETGECLKTYKGHNDIVRCVTMIDDDRFVTCSDGRSIRIWKNISTM